MPAPAHDPAEHHANRWKILAVLGLAQLMVVLDVTIVNIALPSAQSALGFSNDNRQWIVTAYALAFGSFLLLGGRLGDLFGRRRTFIVGLTGFALASAYGGVAQNFGMLVSARALQGAFGALLAPSALGLLTTTFTDPSERGKAFGIFGAIAGGGGAIGLLLGGVLTEYLDWRWCLYVNLLLAVPAAFGAARFIKTPARSGKAFLDIPGTVTASLGLFFVVYGFSNAETASWGDPLTIISLVLSAGFITAFVMLQRRVAHPLLPLSVVLDRNRGGSYLSIGLAGAGVFAVFLFLTYFMQRSLGYSPIQTGLGFLPMMGCVVLTSTVGNTILVPKFGAKPLVPTGMLLGVGAMLFFTQLSITSTYAADILPGLLLMGFGMGLIFAPSFSTATLGVDPSDAGVASAMVNTSQQVGGSIGTALLSTLAASALDSYVTQRGPSPAVLAEAAVHGYTVAFSVAAGIFAFGAVTAALILRPGSPAQQLERAQAVQAQAAPVGQPVPV
jgi:EmrB/QacA subfamily drug resistance transporter